MDANLLNVRVMGMRATRLLARRVVRRSWNVILSNFGVIVRSVEIGAMWMWMLQKEVL